MATPFMAARLELGLPMDADALAAASTKDELLQEARSAGLEVTTSMTKAELAGGRPVGAHGGHAVVTRGRPGRQSARAPRTSRPGRAPVSSPSWRMTSPATMVAR